MLAGSTRRSTAIRARMIGRVFRGALARAARSFPRPEFVAWPIMKKAFAARGLEETPLLSHSFERVMPGREYVSSIRDFWRVCSGCTAEARARPPRPTAT